MRPSISVQEKVGLIIATAYYISNLPKSYIFTPMEQQIACCQLLNLRYLSQPSDLQHLFWKCPPCNFWAHMNLQKYDIGIF